jgi:hypothetical protein
MICLAACGALDQSSAPQHGADLFYGRTAMRGQLHLHNRPLGADYVRCVNCHQLQDQRNSAARFGPDLGQRFLTQPTEHRGGPARAYTVDTFCHMLRTGVDPTLIVINTDMPRYPFSDAECLALWDFLIRH